MKAFELLDKISKMGIDVITGVPDSTLKQFCDGLHTYGGNFRHYTTVNEGAAVGLAVGSYLASGKPACIYMQNSGIGNVVNPLTSLANIDVYGIPMLFIVGWRGEPGVKDEPQHAFQGKITCQLFETLGVPYAVIDKNTDLDDLDQILKNAKEQFVKSEQYAIIVKKGTFETDEKFVWENGNKIVREDALKKLLEIIPNDSCIVSTTGKISRELYEQSEVLFGNHDRLFMTVGGMGHASMIAYGIAQEKPKQRVICMDGDGAVLMHMGALPFIASKAPENFVHIVVNNQAHESVGSMPTDCQRVSISEVAKTAGYRMVQCINRIEELEKAEQIIVNETGPILIEVMVSLESRVDLGRPKETAKENRDGFMEYLRKF